MYGKHTQVPGYLLYPKCHQGKSQDLLSLVPMSISCFGVKNHTFSLGFLYQNNNNLGKNHVVKIWVEALKYFSNLLKLFLLFWLCLFLVKFYSVRESISLSILLDPLYFLVLGNRVFLPSFSFFRFYWKNVLFSSLYSIYLKCEHKLLYTLSIIL